MIRRSIVFALAVLAALGAHAQDASHGQTLYNQTCNLCHGTPPVGGPELAPNNPALIASAINSLVPAMSFMRGLYSTQDLADIAAYIAQLEGKSPPPPPPTPAPQFDYSDLWWNPAESGWGFNVIQHGTTASSVLFCVMFTYIAPEVPMWYVVPGGTWTSSTTFTGSIYRVTGSPPNLAFKGGDVTSVGTMTILFTSQSTANLTFTVNGVTVTKAIQRQPF